MEDLILTYDETPEQIEDQIISTAERRNIDPESTVDVLEIAERHWEQAILNYENEMNDARVKEFAQETHSLLEDEYSRSDAAEIVNSAIMDSALRFLRENHYEDRSDLAQVSGLYSEVEEDPVQLDITPESDRVYDVDNF